MEQQLHHLHTYFFFPFTINKEIASKEHAREWQGQKYWIHGLDACVLAHAACGSPVVQHLGPWTRAAYSHSDMDSPAYQDMIFFHPYVRRIFFDTGDDPGSTADREPLIRCFVIPKEAGRKLWFTGEDRRGRSARCELDDLRLFLFANGMGILSLGIEAHDIPARDALWINETMRKIYPSSGRQIREGRGPCRFTLSMEKDGKDRVVLEETFERVAMNGMRPPLSRVISGLIYFLDYDKEEYDQLLDERMITYTYAAIDPAGLPRDFAQSAEYEVLLSRFLYVDRQGSAFRYEPVFTREQMREHVYRRWAHEGTFYGFTSYSNVTTCLGIFDRGEHVLQEGFLIHRMFDTRYYLMALVALFYRATLLDFAQKTAIVSRRLYREQEVGSIRRETIEAATALRAEFLHFTNYWYFEELANKDEEIEHFTMQCRNYRVGAMKAEIEQEVEKLNSSLHEYYQTRSTEAVNRLAMLSMIFGAGAVVTGFFGMNFGADFERLFFHPDRATQWVYLLAVLFVTLMAFGVLAFGVYLVMANPADYRDILTPRGMRPAKRRRWYSLKRGV
jgi:hypothetical protein